ncbi:MAG: TIGR02757 family protein [Spirochaetales bacterium]|nr:TIGR02757 family protein [Spirochaetales bacterium]
MRRRKTVELTLNRIYGEYHRREMVLPDPLQFLYNYPETEDREIVGLISSSLALGRVNSIIKAINEVLSLLPSPRLNLLQMSERDMKTQFRRFRYRFFSDEDLVDLLLAVKLVLEKQGSLNRLFLSGYDDKDETILPALTHFTLELNSRKKLKMLADPSKNSACKRLMLFLRWMVRSDSVDPGGWTGVSPSKLIIPLDTHMLKVASLLRLTERKDGGMRTAVEITSALKKYDDSDPVRFDFSLTRPGIHPALNYSAFSDR